MEQSEAEKGFFLKDKRPNSHAVFVLKYVLYTLQNKHIDEVKGILCE
jgi:hypothetical protein